MKKNRWLLLTLLLAALSVTAFAEGDETFAIASGEAEWAEFPDLTPIQPAQPATRGLLRGTSSGNSDQAAVRDIIKTKLVAGLAPALQNGLTDVEFDGETQETRKCVVITLNENELYNKTTAKADIDWLVQAYYYALYDYPEDTYCFQSGLSYRYTYNNNDHMLVTFTIYAPVAIDALSAGKDAAYHAALDQACEEAFGISKSNPTSPLSDFEKVVAAHDWIATNCFYDPYVSNGESNYPADAQDPFDNAVPVDNGCEYRYNACSWTSYGLFVNHMAVCQGYALALEAMLDRAGVPCVYVSSDPLNHAWNMVQLDGSWYHVDATWDDPTPDVAGTVRRTDLLLNDSEIRSGKDRNDREKQGHEPNGYVKKYNKSTGEWEEDTDRPWADEPNNNIWTTEGGYTCDSTYPVPELLTNSTLPVYLYKDNSAASVLYMVSGQTIYTFEAGKDFANDDMIAAGLSQTDTLVNGLTQDVFSTAMDYRNGVIYAMEKLVPKEKVDQTVKEGDRFDGTQTLRSLNLDSKSIGYEDKVEAYFIVTDLEYNGEMIVSYRSDPAYKGIWLYDRSAAVQGLCITCNCGALHYWMIGLAQTDDAMPVYIQYSPDMKTVSDVNDYRIFFRRNDVETNYIALLACYNGDGRMLSFTGLDVQDGAADLGDVYIPTDTATVKVFVVSADDATYGKPLSEVLMLPAAASP